MRIYHLAVKDVGDKTYSPQAFFKYSALLHLEMHTYLEG